jgi:uncharacterized ferredoxin-like protein
MIYDEREIRRTQVIEAAKQMMTAARTAPKACGIDHMHTLTLTGADKDAVADEMERLGNEMGAAFFIRDAGNMRAALAMVMIGADSLRDVVAFPKVQNASELMSGCPAPADPKALADLSIAVIDEE